jgi:hypothetical protein
VDGGRAFKQDFGVPGRGFLFNASLGAASGPLGDGRLQWITVKGWPEKRKHQQARHWFAEAIFDLVRYRDEAPSVGLAIGSGFSAYHNLSGQMTWFKRIAPFMFLWVDEDRKVREE